jgi:hypothetical protein
MREASSADAAAASVPAPDLAAALRLAEARMRADGYRGYDPYDGLTSPLFRLPGLRSSKTLRFGVQQVVRRLPLNPRPLLGIRKGYNPVTLALALHGYAHVAGSDPGEAERLVAELDRLASTTTSGPAWGYDFPWQTRYELFPAHTPTIVATAIVTDALVAAHETFGLPRALELCAGAVEFLTSDLSRIPGDGDTFCWSYSPLDRRPVLNATAKGARLLAQVAALADRPRLLETARRTLSYVVAHQRADGAWPYAVDDPRSWSDNFHTGYVLDSLHEYEARSGDDTFAAATRKGWEYYRANFFEDDLVPRYYDRRTYPVDATAVAQSLITLSRFGDAATARAVASWSIRNLQRPDGAFAYQLHRRYAIRIPYQRWSTAWMYCGLAHAAAGEGQPAR